MVSLAYPRTMPPWSGTSCCQWMTWERPPADSWSSPYGVLPAMTMTPAWSRKALCTIAPRFCVPTSTCTNTHCGRPVTCQYPCAAASPTDSKVHGMIRGIGTPASVSTAAASCSGAESVPGWRNRCSTPCSLSSHKRCSPVVFGLNSSVKDSHPPGSARTEASRSGKASLRGFRCDRAEHYPRRAPASRKPFSSSAPGRNGRPSYAGGAGRAVPREHPPFDREQEAVEHVPEDAEQDDGRPHRRQVRPALRVRELEADAVGRPGQQFGEDHEDERQRQAEPYPGEDLG